MECVVKIKKYCAVIFRLLIFIENSPALGLIALQAVGTYVNGEEYGALFDRALFCSWAEFALLSYRTDIVLGNCVAVFLLAVILLTVPMIRLKMIKPMTVIKAKE